MESPNLADKKIYVPSKNVVTRTIADETILVPISGNLANMEQIFTLNEVGASFWQLMDGKKSYADIRHELLEEFNVEEDQLNIDLEEFVNKLRDADLIDEKPAG